MQKEIKSKISKKLTQENFRKSLTALREKGLTDAVVTFRPINPVLDLMVPGYERQEGDHRYILLGKIFGFDLATDADMPKGEVWIKDVDSGEIYYKFKF